MNLERQKKNAIIVIILGAILFAVSVVTGNPEGENAFYDGILSGMASALMAVGIVKLVRYARIKKNPEKAANFESLYTDERIAFISNKARAMTFYISVFAELAAGLIALYVFKERAIGQVFTSLVTVQCLLYVVIYHIFSRRY